MGGRLRCFLPGRGLIRSVEKSAGFWDGDIILVCVLNNSLSICIDRARRGASSVASFPAGGTYSRGLAVAVAIVVGAASLASRWGSALGLCVAHLPTVVTHCGPRNKLVDGKDLMSY